MEDQINIEKLIEEKKAELKRLETLLSERKGFCKEPFINSYGIQDIVKEEKLSNDQIGRYSRQLILPEFGVKGQLALSSKSVLIVGAGGLGCPSAIYLAAAGIGRIGIVDYDEVELNNLHRQILHTEARVGVSKSASIATSCSSLNSNVQCIPYHMQLDSTNALQLIEQYDIVLDATDNVATRYLLNDACVLAGKPLVSGSALRFEGQLTVYNYNGGPCYRCLYPKPPPPETVTNCSDGGVLGVIPGIIGCMQALEAIKICSGMESFSQKLLLFDGLQGMFRTIRLRGKQSTCPACGDDPSINCLIDYEQFCGARANDKDRTVNLLSDIERIAVTDYKRLLDEGREHLVLDVRMPIEMEICQLPANESFNIPISSIDKEDYHQALRERLKPRIDEEGDPFPVVVVCRRGNDSQIAIHKLKDKFKDLNVNFKDVKGGLHAWSMQVDKNFPMY